MEDFLKEKKVKKVKQQVNCLFYCTLAYLLYCCILKEV